MKNATLIAFNGSGNHLEEMKTAIPELKPGEILVENLYTTICGSDLHTFCGLRTEAVPTVLGHEIVGEIVGFHPEHAQIDYLGNQLKIGDRVTWSIFASNADSDRARAGMPQKSDGLFKYGHATITETDALHGGLSTHCVLKNGTTVLKISKEIPLKVAATINCAVATVAGAVRLSGSLKGKKVLISGVGLLGLVAAAMCSADGAEEVHVADVNAERLQLAQSFGAGNQYLLNENAQLPNNIDVVFDMSGSPDAMETGLSTLTVGGTAVWIGAVFKAREVKVNAEQIVRNLITIKGLHNYNHEDFTAAVKFIENNYSKFPFEALVSAEFVLAEAEAAFNYAVANKPIRVGINVAKKAGNEQ
ncbi:alcohol dehydrogenase [Pedobacter sp. Leaf216]|uniref:zinc-binding dehydrogenase n=1 Tax=Pedobacter sp. Leaf216 TaxID=1735684 RepID=UPI00070157A3|nr:zinc-binding dehydrogenase [Pedobacter sp. Leaf216]KQM67303.1 alcohol dehydrogenase [Pedobacter sp. Leaf216]